MFMSTDNHHIVIEGTITDYNYGILAKAIESAITMPSCTFYILTNCDKSSLGIMSHEVKICNTDPNTN